MITQCGEVAPVAESQLSRERERENGGAAHDSRMMLHDHGALAPFERGEPVEERLEAQASLGSGQPGAHAEMRAETERHMSASRPVEVDR